MSLFGKENVHTTPSKDTSNRIVENSPTPSKRSLRPISPNKQNGGGIGKLSFLQSDNIDDHFEYIHNSNEEIKQSLYDIESSTKQTSLDLGQLIDRSKNNNHHLNRVLESIAKYSEEVTTEGNATKRDVTDILQKLETLKNAESKSEIAEVKDMLAKAELVDLKNMVSTISNDYKSSNSKIIEELNQLSISLELQESSSQQDHLSTILKEIHTLKDYLSNQSDSYKGLETRLSLLQSEQELRKRNEALESKYTILCASYKDKYAEYARLEKQYRALEANVKSMVEELKSSDPKKSRNLQQLHSARLDALASNYNLGTSAVPKKRVVSMPIREEKEDKYSDSEEF